MTRAEALAEARRRWGRYGRAVEDVTGCHVWAAFPRTSRNWTVLERPGGAGKTWEEAFADADKRGRR